MAEQQLDGGIANAGRVCRSRAVARAHRPQHLVPATPVAAPDAVESLLGIVEPEVLLDDVFMHDVRSDLSAVGEAYRQFPQTTDAEVTALLDRDRERMGERRPRENWVCPA